MDKICTSPHPLSVKKPKKRAEEQGGAKKKVEKPGERDADNKAGSDGDAAPKPKRRRRHKGARLELGDPSEGNEAAPAPVDAAED